MLIPSIDLMGGRIVQLVQGAEPKLAFDDLEYWIERFCSYPIVQLIDLDAAVRQGDNAALIAKIAKRLPCQVGGGIRTTEDAKNLLEAGARRVILGSALFGPAGVETKTAATLAAAIGREQFVASIDTKGGRIAVRGLERDSGVDTGAGHTRARPILRRLSLHTRRHRGDDARFSV